MTSEIKIRPQPKNTGDGHGKHESHGPNSRRKSHPPGKKDKRLK